MSRQESCKKMIYFLEDDNCQQAKHDRTCTQRRKKSRNLVNRGIFFLSRESQNVLSYYHHSPFPTSCLMGKIKLKQEKSLPQQQLQTIPTKNILIMRIQLMKKKLICIHESGEQRMMMFINLLFI